MIKCICLICSIEFPRYKCHLLSGGGKFCSRKCKDIGMIGKWSGSKNPKYKSNRVGVLNPNWKGGITHWRKKIYNSPTWIKWRKSVFERDNYTCQICFIHGSTYLQANHIKKFSDFPELRFSVDNGITLCKNCHIHLVNNHELEWEEYFNMIIRICK